VSAILRAPFPYPGGKSRAAAAVWAAFGDPAVYVEPFAGSCAVLLHRPTTPRVEIVNDLDGFVANFWRAVSADPAAVAAAADWPVNETDLHAWHRRLVSQRDGLTAMLDADPEAFDAKIAGRWAWGCAQWIGHGWCASSKPGRQLPQLSTFNGVCRLAWGQSAAGAVGSEAVTFASPLEWMLALQARLRFVRVACGDWRRVVTDGVLLSPLRSHRAGSTAAVFLDPPYAEGAQQYAAGGTGTGLSADVRQWALEHGGNPLLRIVLCGYEGEHDLPGWRAVPWVAKGGYGNASGNANRLREVLWLSLACLDATKQRGLFDGGAA